jgi:hypothetical protein
MKMERCQSKGVAGRAVCNPLKRNAMDDGKSGRLETRQSMKIARGGYTPMAMERVRKRFKGKDLGSVHCAKEPGSCWK